MEKQTIDGSPSNEATTSGADMEQRGARLPLSRDAIRHRIVAAVKRLTEEGGERNFVIFRADHAKNYYVQLATSCGSAVVYGEAVSNLCLQAMFVLTPAQIATLRQLGWQFPTKSGFPNFHRWWPVIRDPDRGAIADVVLATLERVYGWRADTSLLLRLHLDW